MRHLNVRSILSLTTLLLTLLTQTALADWQLNKNQSDIFFVSTKKNSISEINHFKGLSGTIKNDGAVTVSIDLSTVETHIPIRNERLQSLFFQTHLFPKAVITLKLSSDQLEILSQPGVYTERVTLTLSLHGMKQTLESRVNITHFENQIIVTTPAPIIVNTADFNLSEGLNQLRDIAQLSVIDTTVPVTVSLVFSQATKTP